jgi:adenylosuccinate synthase
VGDEAKRKIVSSLLKHNKYDWVFRWNAGHTIYINNKKYNTNIVPSGIFDGIKCYIGPDCYVNIDDLEKEMLYLKENGYDISLIKISSKAHIITK